MASWKKNGFTDEALPIAKYVRTESLWLTPQLTLTRQNNVIGILTALEFMLKNGWRPARTVVAAFGMDEEVGGGRGAASISDFLQDKYGKYGIAMIVDEGGMGIETLYGTQFALPGMAEKGYGNFMIKVDVAGGHSSIPSKHTSIGILSKIISEIEDQELFEPDLRQTSPMWGYLQCVAVHGNKLVPAWIRDAVNAKQPDLKALAQEFAKVSPANRYLIQTSKAATVVTGGNKVSPS
jgi:Gly-Xaa carboxypeptidase